MEDTKHTAVLHWLQNFKATMPDEFALSIICKCKLEDVLRYMRFPGFYSYRWGNEMTQNLEHAIDFIARHYLIPFPEITGPTHAEKDLVVWLNENYNILVYRERLFYHPFTIHYFIQYLQRDAIIYQWNASEVLKYQKRFELLFEEERYAKVIWGI
jgi:hypothetical protein